MNRINSKHHNQYAQRFIPHQRFCEVRMDSDRIEIRTQDCNPSLLRRVADGLENECLCAYTIVEKDAIYLMQPDYGMFGDDAEFREIVAEMFKEENYEMTFLE